MQRRRDRKTMRRVHDAMMEHVGRKMDRGPIPSEMRRIAKDGRREARRLFYAEHGRKEKAPGRKRRFALDTDLRKRLGSARGYTLPLTPFVERASQPIPPLKPRPSKEVRTLNKREERAARRRRRSIVAAAHTTRIDRMKAARVV